VTVIVTVASFNPTHPSQSVVCNVVDNALAKIPQGNGDGTVTDLNTRLMWTQYPGDKKTFQQAVRNATPVLEVRPRRVGGATYQVPVEVPEHRALSLAMRWLIQSSRARPGKSMAEKLANELMDAAKGVGVTIKRRDDTHRMAEANRAFAHYRW